MKLKVLSSVFIKKELYFAASQSRHDIEIKFFGYDAVREDIQREIDNDTQSDFIVLAVNEDIAEGITGGKAPITVPRIHNCAQLLLGSRERFYNVFCENEDSPDWIDSFGNFAAKNHGRPCYIGGLFPRPALPESTREYIGDLTLLRELIDGKWDSRDFFIIHRGERIIKDPVEILDSEAF